MADAQPSAALHSLAPCPATPNCVSTEAPDKGRRMRPIRFAGSATDARTRLRAVLAGMPRARVVHDADGYVRAEFTTRLLGFVDDVEFVIDPVASVVRFRSASRVGRSDFGANRRRMEEVTREFEAG